VPLAVAALAVSPAQAAGPRCTPIDTTGEPTLGNNPGPRAPGYFASDFPVIADQTLGYPIGGFGGIARLAPLHHTPVVFVHGNQVDAQNWLDVMLQFQNDAGYSMQEMYALSYNGLENYYAGAPVATLPTQEDANYIEQNQTVLANGGHGAADDDNVVDLCRFIEAVQVYTGSPQIDIVAHSLGVTLARKLMAVYPKLARDVVAFVGIAGANHGTTVCRGLETTYYGCNEIAPGSAMAREPERTGRQSRDVRPDPMANHLRRIRGRSVLRRSGRGLAAAPRRRQPHLPRRVPQRSARRARVDTYLSLVPPARGSSGHRRRARRSRRRRPDRRTTAERALRSPLRRACADRARRRLQRASGAVDQRLYGRPQPAHRLLPGPRWILIRPSKRRQRAAEKELVMSTEHEVLETSIRHAVRDGIARAIAVIGLAGVALIHLLDAPGKFQETPYLGWLYIALIGGSVLTAAALIRQSDSRAWVAAAVLPLGAILGYTLTRTTGLPQATGDIGNWGEPLGMASLFVEGSLVALSAMVLRDRARAEPSQLGARRAPLQSTARA